jgi:hypothetical protein
MNEQRILAIIWMLGFTAGLCVGLLARRDDGWWRRPPGRPAGTPPPAPVPDTIPEALLSNR